MSLFLLERNVAFNKSSNQSSQLDIYNSRLATDGYISSDTDYQERKELQFSSTNAETNQWWRVYLGQEYMVYKVVIWGQENDTVSGKPKCFVNLKLLSFLVWDQRFIITNVITWLVT